MNSRITALGIVACASLLTAVIGFAQNYPTKPIRIIAQLQPGTSTDILARVIGQKLSESWGQQVVFDNQQITT